MLRVNGQVVIWEQDEALAMILRVAEGTCQMDEWRAWFPLTVQPYSLPPDSEADMRLIGQIIDGAEGAAE